MKDIPKKQKNSPPTAGAVASCFVNVQKRHPLRDKPLIAYEVALMMEPMTMLGALCGTLLNKVRWPIQDILSLVFVYAESIIPLLPPPTSHYPHYCNTIAQYMTSPRPSLYMLCIIQYW